MKIKKIILNSLLIFFMFVLVQTPKTLFASENLREESKEISASILKNDKQIVEYENIIKKNKSYYDMLIFKNENLNNDVIKLEKNIIYLNNKIKLIENKEMVFIDKFLATLTNTYDDFSEEEINFLITEDYESFEEVLNKKLRDEDKEKLIIKLNEHKMLLEDTILYEKKQIKLNKDKIYNVKKSIEKYEGNLNKANENKNELISIKNKNELKILEEKLKNETFILPTQGNITSKFGYRMHPILKKRILHSGIDMANSEGTNIVASRNGKVIFTGDNGGYGNTIIIDHGNGYKTLYAHLSKIDVSVGSKITQGDNIGRMGSTGRSTGSHLHFEIQKNDNAIDPFLEINK